VKGVTCTEDATITNYHS